MLFIIIGVLPVHGETELYENVLRLHVIANSDSDEDQQLKLKVRDAILSECGHLFSDCKSKNEAQNTVEKNLSLIESTAKKTLLSYGCDHGVSVSLGEETYPTRSYGSICFPAGDYLSLRIIIGEGTGQNWWCVLFPPMCMSAASYTDTNVSVPVGLTAEQYKLITKTNEPKYNIRFKILEAFSS